MIKNAEKIDYDIKSTPWSKNETDRLSKIIAAYKKKKALKRTKRKSLSQKATKTV
jgi:hypothetical protein